MPGVLSEDAPVASAPPPQETETTYEYTVLKQKVDLDVDFARRSIKGTTELTIQPHTQQLREIHLHCRQCRPISVQVGGLAVRDYSYDDPYRRIQSLPEDSNVRHHDLLKRKVGASVRNEREMTIGLPNKLKIKELALDPATSLPQYRIGVIPSLVKQESDAMAMPDVLGAQNSQSAMPSSTQQFAPLKLFIEFEVPGFRDGLHWVGFDDGLDARYPYCYVKASPEPGVTSCIFPCVDDKTSRCAWEISIRTSRTLGDALRRPRDSIATLGRHNDFTNSIRTSTFNDSFSKPSAALSAPVVKPPELSHEFFLDLTKEEAELDLAILCTGDMSDDVVDTEDETRHTVTFNVNGPVCARHIGFAIGPFETVHLSTFRDVEEEERLGQSAVRVVGYCPPGRTTELKNTSFPLTQCVDFYGVNFGSSPFPTHEILFVDDLVHDATSLAGFTFASTRLLFPEDILEPLEKTSRLLARAVAQQWVGVNVIPASGKDEWITAGISGYMADLFMKKLSGNNSYRWQQKLAAEKVYEVDVDRPSISELGNWLHLDSEIREFVNLKSALVMFILDRRLLKASGATGVTRIVNRILLQAKTGSLDNGQITTDDFQRTCERLGHNKLDSFFKQWILGAGCPIFYVTQRFNKKKLVVEIEIRQRQNERKTKPPFAPDNFARLVKEHTRDMWAGSLQKTFTGPMTIRIHEADGTPYEHIVEITESPMKFEIPYNTKYKRLKRSRRQKERTTINTDSSVADNSDGNDSLLYCLGDILDSPQEMTNWKLVEWAREEEDKMGQESYEWIRMDADFEWIGKIHLVMPLYMYISQLQQDRDLVAQYESMRFLLGSNPHQMSLTILVRTLMDVRYFWGIREMAADGIAILAKSLGNVDLSSVGCYQLEKAFSEMFCIEGSIMPRPNDFSDRVNFLIQCAIPRAMAKLRDADGKVPMQVRRFYVDKLKFNDNSTNEFSDVHYISVLLECLADSIIASHREPQPSYSFSFGEDDPMDAYMLDDPDKDFEREAVAEIERFRRIDEWISSYRNLYSTTVLDCLQKLERTGVVKARTFELLQYTRPGNADNVRLQAFICLNETGAMKKMRVMRYLLHTLAEDPSPYLRDRLMKCFGEALGHIALGGSENITKEAPDTDANLTGADALILENETNSEARHLEITRKENVDGALPALKSVLEHNSLFMSSLWRACTSSILTLQEVASLVDVAALIYVPTLSFKVALHFPRHWKCELLRSGKLRFYQTNTYRTHPLKQLLIEDWEEMQKLNLKYSGPLSALVKRAQEQENVRVLKEQIDRAEKLQAQRIIPSLSTPITQMSPPPQRPPPPEHRPSIKLNFGKRKQSISEPQRESSTKVPKISRQQTPNGNTSVSQQRVSPGVPIAKPGPGKNSVSSTIRATPMRSKVVRLPYSSELSPRIQHIFARPASRKIASHGKEGVRMTRSPDRGSDPIPSSTDNDVLGGSSDLLSPSGSVSDSSAFLNAGAFRSFDPIVPALADTTDSRDDENRTFSEFSTAWGNRVQQNAESHSHAPDTSTGTTQGSQPLRNIITLKFKRKPSSDIARAQ